MLKLFALAQVFAAEASESLKKREEGQTMAEYGVVLAVITLVVIGAISLLSTHVKNAITNVANILPGNQYPGSFLWKRGPSFGRGPTPKQKDERADSREEE